MKINGKPYRTIWVAKDGRTIEVIDQTRLPHDFAVKSLTTLTDVCAAIQTMVVRGAPLIGATGAYGLALAMSEDPSDGNLSQAYKALLETRPTAVNLRWALDDVRAILRPLAPSARASAAYARAAAICDEDVAINRSIGQHGAALLRDLWTKKEQSRILNILTHCNAGWLATVDWGTALAPIYSAYEAGLPVHVWVDETRPRNQGASLTAWELGAHGIPHTLIADNAGGYLMQRGQVDLCIVGTDRVTVSGDVCNKIGTYLKALAAQDNTVPFFVALPSPTIDWRLEHGQDVPIEERSPREVTHIMGRDEQGTVREVEIAPPGTLAANPAFDVTPARLVTALITDRGITKPTREGLLSLFPERKVA